MDNAPYNAGVETLETPVTQPTDIDLDASTYSNPYETAESLQENVCAIGSTSRDTTLSTQSLELPVEAEVISVPENAASASVRTARKHSVSARVKLRLRKMWNKNRMILPPTCLDSGFHPSIV